MRMKTRGKVRRRRGDGREKTRKIRTTERGKEGREREIRRIDREIVAKEEKRKQRKKNKTKAHRRAPVQNFISSAC